MAMGWWDGVCRRDGTSIPRSLHHLRLGGDGRAPNSRFYCVEIARAGVLPPNLPLPDARALGVRARDRQEAHPGLTTR